MTELPLITVKKYVKDLDDSLILGFKAFDEESQRKLYAYTINANDQVYFYDALRNNDYIIFKLDSFRINFDNGEIAFKTKVTDIYFDDLDRILPVLKNHVKSTIYVKARLGYVRKTKHGKVRVYADEVSLIVADYDEETAKALLNEYEPLDLICYALGYEPSTEIKAITLPRIIPLFKPFGLGVHVIQFTPPETGKTHTAKTISALTNSYHALGFPSRAKLIGDARFNSYGICYKYDTIYVEEFEKLSGKRLDEFREDYEILLTGLEQGKWQREKSSRTDIDYINPIGFCIFGNIRDRDISEYTVNEYTQNNRERIKAIIENMTGLNILPFISRFTYVEAITEDVKCMRYILYNENNEPQALHPSVSRAIFDILINEATNKAIRIRKDTSRRERHINTLKSILDLLNVDLDDDTIERLVDGKTTFLDVFGNESKTDTVTEDDIKYEEWDMREVTGI